MFWWIEKREKLWTIQDRRDKKEAEYAGCKNCNKKNKGNLLSGRVRL